MNEITIRPEITLQEAKACQDALYGKGPRIVAWALLATGAAALASNAALTWGTPASILAWLALAALIFNLYFNGQITARRRRQSYKRYSESNASYIFTNEQIVATSRHVEATVAWAAVDRVMEVRAIYLLVVGNSYICVPKRDIPSDVVGGFIELLRTHGLSDKREPRLVTAS